MSRAEMDELGWDSCDIILVTGDAYIDHPSFGMALVGRLLEAQGFRVGIISQPDWLSAQAFRALGKPNLFFGVTAGNMDSMVNRYTADRKPRSDDAYTPNGEPNRRPDRAVVVYAQRCREAFPGANVVIGSIEASLRRIAHYDYWSDKVRRSVLPDSKADLLIFGSAERAIVELAHRLAAGEKDRRDPRPARHGLHGAARLAAWRGLGRNRFDRGRYAGRWSPRRSLRDGADAAAGSLCRQARAACRGRTQVIQLHHVPGAPADAEARSGADRDPPAFLRAGGKDDPVLYAHASRTFHSNRTPAMRARWCRRTASATSGSTRRRSRCRRRRWTASSPALPAPAASVLRRGEDSGLRDDPLLGQHHARLLRRLHLLLDHRARGRIIQSRSEQSILHEIEEIRDKTPGFTGVISDLGGPTANMYRLACKDPKIESPAAACPASSPASARTSTPTTRRWSSSTARRARCRASRRC
jgi:hypothetical protein